MENILQNTILVVDDIPDNLDVLLTYLDDYGFAVLVAQSGEEALGIAQQLQPDIILLDIMMPGIDGFETCRRLKQQEQTQHIPVIFITALSETKDKIEGFTAGGVDYITKPFKHKEVLARVKTHLTIQNLQKQLAEQNVCLEAQKRLLSEQNQQLQAVNASKDTFFSILSHDLRNPFSMVQIFSELIAGHPVVAEHEQLKRYSETLIQAANQFSDLLKNLLDWSIVQGGMIKFQPRCINLVEIIERNVVFFSAMASQKQIYFSSRREESLFIYADRRMIDTVIRNLISNALKFTHSGGTVEISIRQDAEAIELSVSDTGIGIAPERLTTLFQLDKRQKTKGTANEEGTGLGLILCKDLLEKNDGAIRVESAVGRGTTFYCSFPNTTEREAH